MILPPLLRRNPLLLCVAGLLLIGNLHAGADTVDLQIEYDSSTLEWELYAQVVTTGSGSSGAYGVSAVRALVDNIPLSTVALASGIGAINPINLGGSNQRPAAVATNGGTIDIIYVQNLAAPGTVVEGVGVGIRSLIASGSYLNAAVPPSFGNDDFGDISDGNFLNRLSPSTYGAAFPWDGVSLGVIDVSPQGIVGDYNNDGFVNLADYTVWRDHLGAPAGSLENDPHNSTVGAAQYNTWKSNFGDSLISGTLHPETVPEPQAVMLAIAGVLVALGGRGRRHPRHLR